MGNKTSKTKPPDVESGQPSAEEPQPSKPCAEEIKVQILQKQVDEVVDIMRMNIEKVMLRDEKIEHLEEVSDYLIESSKVFKKTSTKVSRRYYWKNKKYTIVLGGIGLLIMAIIIIAILFSVKVIPL